MAMVGFSQHTPAAGGSAPTFVSVGASGASLSTIDLAWGAGHQADDVAIAVLKQRDADAAQTPSTGWTTLTDVTSTNMRLIVYWARATGSSEANLTAADPGQHWGGQIMVFRGCRTGSVPIALLAQDTDAGDTAIDIPSGTTSGNNRLVLTVCVGDTAIGQSLTAGLTNAGLDTMTTHVNFTFTQGNDGIVIAGSGGLATAGSTGVTTGTLAVSDEQIRATYELIP